MKINPHAVVPTLDRGGRIVIESNVIREFLEDSFSTATTESAGRLGQGPMRLFCSEGVARENIATCSCNLATRQGAKARVAPRRT